MFRFHCWTQTIPVMSPTHSSPQIYETVEFKMSLLDLLADMNHTVEFDIWFQWFHERKYKLIKTDLASIFKTTLSNSHQIFCFTLRWITSVLSLGPVLFILSPDPWSLLLLFWLKLLNSAVMSSPRTLLQLSMRNRTSSHTCRRKQHSVTAWTLWPFLSFCFAAVADCSFSLLHIWTKAWFCLCRGLFVEAKCSAVIQQTCSFQLFGKAWIQTHTLAEWNAWNTHSHRHTHAPNWTQTHRNHLVNIWTLIKLDMLLCWNKRVAAVTVAAAWFPLWPCDLNHFVVWRVFARVPYFHSREKSVFICWLLKLTLQRLHKNLHSDKTSW